MQENERRPDFWQNVLNIAKANRKKIGIGIKWTTPKILESLEKARAYVDVVVVGEEVEGFESVKSENPEPLMQMAKDGKIDGLVRGNFDAVEAYNAAKKILNHEDAILEINFFKLNGVNMINEHARGVFCILPVSFTNERVMEDKVKSIDLHLEFFKKIGMIPKLGILAPGKPADIAENIPEVTAGLEEAQKLVDFYTQKGIWAKHFNHQIEKAVLEANIIVAQNSWTGNMAAHCLLYLGSCEYLGAIALNIKDIVYVDDSEAMEDFTNCLILAGFFANNKK